MKIGKVNLKYIMFWFDYRNTNKFNLMIDTLQYLIELEAGNNKIDTGK